MTILDAPMNQSLLVRSFASGNETEFSDVESRLMLLGFVSGQIVRVTRKAPFFKGPFLVEVRGRSIALTASEASLVNVEEIQ